MRVVRWSAVVVAGLLAAGCTSGGHPVDGGRRRRRVPGHLRCRRCRRSATRCWALPRLMSRRCEPERSRRHSLDRGAPRVDPAPAGVRPTESEARARAASREADPAVYTGDGPSRLVAGFGLVTIASHYWRSPSYRRTLAWVVVYEDDRPRSCPAVTVGARHGLPSPPLRRTTSSRLVPPRCRDVGGQFCTSATLAVRRAR